MQNKCHNIMGATHHRTAWQPCERECHVGSGQMSPAPRIPRNRRCAPHREDGATLSSKIEVHARGGHRPCRQQPRSALPKQVDVGRVRPLAVASATAAHCERCALLVRVCVCVFGPAPLATVPGQALLRWPHHVPELLGDAHATCACWRGTPLSGATRPNGPVPNSAASRRPSPATLFFFGLGG